MAHNHSLLPPAVPFGWRVEAAAAERLRYPLMNMTRLAIAFLCLTFAGLGFAADCSDASSYASDAYTYARRAYLADNLDDALRYAKKARNAAEEAMNAAQDCGCDDAYSAAEEAYTYARRAYRSDSLAEAQNYARKAKNAAEEASSAADSCSDE